MVTGQLAWFKWYVRRDQLSAFHGCVVGEEFRHNSTSRLCYPAFLQQSEYLEAFRLLGSDPCRFPSTFSNGRAQKT